MQKVQAVSKRVPFTETQKTTNNHINYIVWPKMLFIGVSNIGSKLHPMAEYQKKISIYLQNKTNLANFFARISFVISFINASSF